VGLIRGSIQPAQLGMNAIGPFATGLWYVANRSYTVPFAAFALFFLLAGLAIALAPYPRLGPARAAAGEPTAGDRAADGGDARHGQMSAIGCSGLA